MKEAPSTSFVGWDPRNRERGKKKGCNRELGEGKRAGKRKRLTNEKKEKGRAYAYYQRSRRGRDPNQRGTQSPSTRAEGVGGVPPSLRGKASKKACGKEKNPR